MSVVDAVGASGGCGDGYVADRLCRGDREAVRAFISYAHEDAAYQDRVRSFWLFLRANGVDARLDLPAAEQRVDWAQWMTQEIRDAAYVLVVASPAYKQRAEGDAGPGEGRGAQWEARLIRDRIYADQERGLRQVLPVVLPGGSAADIPLWLAPQAATRYEIDEYTVAGAEAQLRVLTGQPWEVTPPLGTIPVLPSRDTALSTTPASTGPMLHTEVVIEASLEGGELISAVWLAGAQLCRQRVPLPPGVAGVWAALRLPPLAAGERMAEAGRRLAGALLDEPGEQALGGLLAGLPPGDTVEVVLAADGPALALPVELLRLASDTGAGRK